MGTNFDKETAEAKSWVGESFKSWCESDPKDARVIYYESTPLGKFTSNDVVPYTFLINIARCEISDIYIDELGWHVWLV